MIRFIILIVVILLLLGFELLPHNIGWIESFFLGTGLMFYVDVVCDFVQRKIKKK